MSDSMWVALLPGPAFSWHWLVLVASHILEHFSLWIPVLPLFRKILHGSSAAVSFPDDLSSAGFSISLAWRCGRHGDVGDFVVVWGSLAGNWRRRQLVAAGDGDYTRGGCRTRPNIASDSVTSAISSATTVSLTYSCHFVVCFHCRLLMLCWADNCLATNTTHSGLPGFAGGFDIRCMRWSEWDILCLVLSHWCQDLEVSK